MRTFILLLLALAGLLVSSASFGAISTMGETSATLQIPNGRFSEGFAFRVVGANGQPRQGVIVDIFVNAEQMGVPPPGYVPPPAGLYGRFEAPSGGYWRGGTTDADGVVRTPAFIAGTAAGRYQVAAYVSWMSNPANVDVTGGLAYADIIQYDPAGTSSASVPASSPASRALLGLLLLLAAGCVLARRRAKR